MSCSHCFRFYIRCREWGNWAGNSQNLRRRVIATQMFCTCGFRFSRCNRHPLVCQLSTEKISAIIRDQPQPTGLHQMCILSVLSRHLASILLPSFLLKARANFDLDCFMRIIPQHKQCTAVVVGKLVVFTQNWFSAKLKPQVSFEHTMMSLQYFKFNFTCQSYFILLFILFYFLYLCLQPLHTLRVATKVRHVETKVICVATETLVKTYL